MKQDDSMQFAIACPPEFALVNKRLYWKVCAVMEKDKASGDRKLFSKRENLVHGFLGKRLLMLHLTV